MKPEEKQQIAGVTFAVSDVARATVPIDELPYEQALAVVIGQDSALEAYSRNTTSLIKPCPAPDIVALHPFFYAANCAYDQHRPLALSPDMIWLLIAQGVALHINTDAETLRERFVSHKGQMALTLRRDNFLRGFAGNDWEGAFSDFSEQIRAHLGASTYDLIVRRFSTTGRVEQAAFEITLMEAVKTYFNFELLTACGIPEITLEGSWEDWMAVRAGAMALSGENFDLDWWVQPLLPVLDQFVAASQGSVDDTFWRNFYKWKYGSGGPYISGHVVNFLPYLRSALPDARDVESSTRYYRDRLGLPPDEVEARLVQRYEGYGKTFRNRYLGWQAPASTRRAADRITTALLPPAQSFAPFTWEYYEKSLPMEFVAGFVGVSQNADTLALRPEIGWAVRNARPEPSTSAG